LQITQCDNPGQPPLPLSLPPLQNLAPSPCLLALGHKEGGRLEVI
jgi:hypothetical protein